MSAEEVIIRVLVLASAAFMAWGWHCTIKGIRDHRDKYDP